jgi:hypothetical protein
MNTEEKEEYETLQENESYLYEYIDLLYQSIKEPEKWQSFINLTSPLMAKTLEQIIAQGPDPKIPA